MIHITRFSQRTQEYRNHAS